jgi:hypothetical protein
MYVGDPNQYRRGGAGDDGELMGIILGFTTCGKTGGVKPVFR